MAIGKKPTAVEQGPDPNLVASGNLDDFIQGGLIDDFNGTIVKARYKPWNYGGKAEQYVLGVALEIHPDEGEGEAFEQTYSAGDLDQFVPSVDGRNPVDLTGDEVTEAQEGVYAFKVGKKAQLNNNTNWAHFLQALRDADPKKLVTPAADVRFLEGVRAHFNRIPQKKRPGLVQPVAAEGEQRREKTILVITEVLGVGAEAPAKTAAPAPKKAAAPAAKAATPAAPATGDLDSRIRDIIAENITAEGTPASSLTQTIMKAFTGPEKAKAVKRYNEAAFRTEESEKYLYDEETATFFAVE